MTYAEAKRHIWERLATTVAEDGRNVNWTEEGEGFTEKDADRLERASFEIARIIRRKLRAFRAKRSTLVDRSRRP